MPRPKKYDDANNYVHDISDDKLSIVGDKIVKKTKTGNPQLEAVKKYEQKFEQLTVRLPKGSRDKLQDYISGSDKYKSVNAMIKDLLEKEIKQTLD